jgi:hypothetical protein
MGRGFFLRVAGFALNLLQGVGQFFGSFRRRGTKGNAFAGERPVRVGEQVRDFAKGVVLPGRMRSCVSTQRGSLQKMKKPPDCSGRLRFEAYKYVSISPVGTVFPYPARKTLTDIHIQRGLIQKNFHRRRYK